MRVVDFLGDRPRALTRYEGADADLCSWEALFLSDVAGDGDDLHRELARLFVTQALEARSVCLAVVEEQLSGSGARGPAGKAQAASPAGAGAAAVCFFRGAGCDACDAEEGASGASGGCCAEGNGAGAVSAPANGKHTQGEPSGSHSAGDDELDESRLVAAGAADLCSWCTTDELLQDELCQLSRSAHRVRFK